MEAGSTTGMERADFLRAGLWGTAATLATFVVTPANKASAASLEDDLSTLILCKKLLVPALEYTKIAQYDAARTNINYCTRILKVKKAIDETIKRAYDFTDDVDKIEKAVDLAQVAEAAFTNFDSSVYTVIFIPPDESGNLPPGADKYLGQAFKYCGESQDILDFIISLAPADAISRANALADKRVQELPKFLFKTFPKPAGQGPS